MNPDIVTKFFCFANHGDNSTYRVINEKWITKPYAADAAEAFALTLPVGKHEVFVVDPRGRGRAFRYEMTVQLLPVPTKTVYVN